LARPTLVALAFNSHTRIESFLIAFHSPLFFGYQMIFPDKSGGFSLMPQNHISQAVFGISVTQYYESKWVTEWMSLL
jgi:hypothetical protein